MSVEPLAEAEINRTIVARMDDVRVVIGVFYKALLPAFLATLAVVCSMALKGRTLPISLIFEGYSGYGKTATLQALLAEALLWIIYRSDKFSPSSFVSHATNVKRRDLGEVDLLPKLQLKVLVTKELAPLFRGREDALVETFSNLCTVLDGKGLTTDSGSHGQRGYKHNIIFNWLGATTPIPASTHALMYQLGTRLLFFEIPADEVPFAELVDYAEDDNSKEAEDSSREQLTIFLTDFFEQHPVDSVEPERIRFPKHLVEQLVHWAQLLAAGRRKIQRERENNVFESRSSNPIGADPPENPRKIIQYLRTIARGHALANGRYFVNESDLALIEHIAISSIPSYLRPMVRTLKTRVKIDSTEAAALSYYTQNGSPTQGISEPTSRKYLLELSLLGFGSLEKGNSNQPDVLIRSDKYSWLSQV